MSGSAFDEAFGRSPLLLHVEAFDEASIDFVQHSISTKIADCLASGIPLLAYAPESVSSMKHLLRHKCALTATTKAELRAMLLKAFSQREELCHIANNALITAKEFHEQDTVSIHLHELIHSVINAPRE